LPGYQKVAASLPQCVFSIRVLPNVAPVAA
jgi:hypothetical protein